MKTAYLQLGLAALLPVVSCVILYLLNEKTGFGRLNNKLKQLIFGCIFGVLAIIGTEYGIPINEAQVNCRDAAVLSAGLFFGGPAGIIAGLIAGLERWFAVYWGVGSFTRLACTVSTIIAGVYGALLRRFLFDNKRPGWLISLVIGIVMEVFHLTMVFITNMAEPLKAMSVVKSCTLPMVIANGLSVMLSAMFISLFSHESLALRRLNIRISQTIQRWFLIAILLAFAATSYFVFSLQNGLAAAQTDSLLDIAIKEVSQDIQDASDANMLSVTSRIAKEIGNSELIEIAQKYDVSEINIINKDGIIIQSTEPEFINFRMSSGEQSAEFLCLLGDETSYVQEYGPLSYDKTISRKYAGIKHGSGFIQVGYDAEIFQKDIDSVVVGITKNRHVGKTGFILILDKNYDVVSAPENFSIESFASKAKDSEIPPADTTFELSLPQPSFCRYNTSEGYYILSILPQSEAFQLRNIAIYVNSFMEIFVFFILFILICLLINSIVVKRIKDINVSLAKITDGDLSEVVDVRSNKEFSSLSNGINSTVDTLKNYISEASARIDKELELAKDIQCSALPNVFPAFPKRKDFDIYALMDPAKEVGGDFYDFYITHTNTLHFVVADVSGKGIPAAMFMMRAKTELKTLTEADLPLNEVFTVGNKALCEGNNAGMFVTAWQGSVDLEDGIVQYANAGHNPPLILHADGQISYLKTRPGFVLAGMDGVKYKTQQLQLVPGDTLFLYTDGVTEATNSQNELFGEERLMQAIQSAEFHSMEELCNSVKASVDSFVASAPQFDDITMVALKYIGAPLVPSIAFEKAGLEDIVKVTEFVEQQLEKIECPMKTIIQFNIAIDEIFSNIVKYGYPKTPGAITVEVLFDANLDTVSLCFTDEGLPYNPLTKEDPDITLSAEDRSIGGLGIYMVKKTMDDMRYRYENDKNILTITKKL